MMSHPQASQPCDAIQDRRTWGARQKSSLAVPPSRHAPLSALVARALPLKWLPARLACRAIGLLMVAVSTGSYARDAVDDLLDTMVMSAVQTHPSSMQARYMVNAAELAATAAARGRWPTPTVSASAADGAQATEFRLTRYLIDWGRVEAGVSAADNRSKAAYANMVVMRRGLAASVIDAWRSLALSIAREKVYTDAALRLARYEAGARARHDAGVSADVDLALVRARVSQLQVEMIANSYQTQTSLYRLKLLGADTDAAQRLTQVTLAGPVGTAVGPVLEVAERNSPVLVRLEAESAAVADDAAVLASQSLPTVNLVLAHQHAANGTQRINDSRVMLTLEYTPGAGFASREAAAAARARALALQAERDAALVDLQATVVAEYDNLKSLSERLSGDASTAASSLAVLQSFERQFDAGRRSWLDVLNSARELMLAELQASSTRMELLSSYARLRLTTGKLAGAALGGDHGG